MGTLEFVDKSNDIVGKLSYAEKGGWFKKKTQPLDCLSGEITYKGEKVCDVEGSYLENLKFGDEVYWDLKSTSMIRPIRTPTCLPSDVRYREDANAVIADDLVLA